MSDIKSKLERLKTTHVAAMTFDVESDDLQLAAIQAEIVANDWGSCVKRTRVFSGSPFPEFNLEEFAALTGDDFAHLGKDQRLSALTPESVLFFDLETTGLAGGTGTLPFLIGLGHFREHQLVINQYFMRDFADEPAALRFVLQELQDVQALVSFNGRSYDWPLLRNRLVLQRLAGPNHLSHLDLLHTTRRLFRRKLPSCDLQSYEKAILKFIRTGDIPGREIPSTYFAYLHHQQIASLRPVFLHNAMDLVTLCAMAAKNAPFFRPTTWENVCECDIHGVINTLQALSLPKLRDLLGVYMAGNAVEDDPEIAFIYADTCKRLGDWEKSQILWQKLEQTSAGWMTAAAIELAKYHEHRRRDPDTALEHVCRAQQRLALRRDMGLPVPSPTLETDLLHRSRRLNHKINKRKTSDDPPNLSAG